ncbi:hypothetical protein DRJ25_00150 [Candidatus Woesearchaeota archaeon]|nr:MAG: hypothetical protein DRJ25_00150 [Candidatus Woesearchaeota archaeon]
MRKEKIMMGLFLLVILLGCQPAQTMQEVHSKAGNKFVLDNGFTIITRPNKNTGLAVFDLFIKTGTLTETIPGISYLTTKAILTGTNTRTRQELISLLEKDGGSFEVKPTAQYDEIRITVPSTAISTAIEFLSEILKNPSIEEKEVEKEKQTILNEIKEKKDNPQAISDGLLFKELFAGTPYFSPVEGTEKSLSSITRKDVKDYFNNYFVPNNMVLVIAGNINENLVPVLADSLGALPKKHIPTKELNFKPYSNKRIEKNSYAQAFYVNIGYRTVPAVHKDTVALKALHGLLGQGPASRLFYNVREKQGLTYRLESINPTIKDTGMFKISFITRPKNLNKTISEVLKQIKRIKNERISAKELAEVKSRIKGYYALSHQLSSDITEYLGLYEVTGRGFEWDYYFPKAIDQITAEDIQNAAKKYLNDPVITIVGPIENAEIKAVD